MSNGNGSASKGVYKVYPPIWDPTKTPKPEAPQTTDKDAPPEQEQKPGSKPIDDNPTTTQAHTDVAKAELAQKNRKRRHGPRMELPFDPTMEEGSVWNLSGFAPNFDGKWMVTEVIFTLTGKGGSRMEIDLHNTVYDKITTPHPTTPTSTAEKRKLTANPPVGAEPNPVPVNLGFGGQNPSWLPEKLNVALASRK